jgi:hypothetical protein
VLAFGLERMFFDGGPHESVSSNADGGSPSFFFVPHLGRLVGCSFAASRGPDRQQSLKFGLKISTGNPPT